MTSKEHLTILAKGASEAASEALRLAKEGATARAVAAGVAEHAADMWKDAENGESEKGWRQVAEETRRS